MTKKKKDQLNPLSHMPKARSDKALAYRDGREPDDETRKLLSTNLGVSTVDSHLRRLAADPDFDLREAHAAHLVGLVLMTAGVNGEAVQLLEQLTRDAVRTARATKAVG